MNVVIALLLLAGAVESSRPSPSGERATVIGFCQLPIQEIYARMSGEFALSVGFSVDKDGRPKDIAFESGRVELLEGSATEEETVRMVQPCLEQWRLPKAAAGAHLTATFVWRHEQGWRELRIEGGGVDTVIEVSGDSCPYGP